MEEVGLDTNGLDKTKKQENNCVENLKFKQSTIKQKSRKDGPKPNWLGLKMDKVQK